MILDAQAACTTCGSVPCAPVEQWPADVPQWLSAMHLALYFRPHLNATRQYRAEFLLRGVMTGHSWDGKLVRLATPAVECLPIAVEQANRWATCGKPREASEMITLSRVGV